MSREPEIRSESLELENPNDPLDLSMARSLPSLVVAEVTCTEHPTLIGRVRCRFGGATQDERWFPKLHGLSVRTGDRVLLSTAANYSEAIVTGVIDGFRVRREPTRFTRAELALLSDERLAIIDEGGRPLVEIVAGESGPVVRLLAADVEIETPGRLRFTASSIELAATSGPVRIGASEDVVVQGESIHLN